MAFSKIKNLFSQSKLEVFNHSHILNGYSSIVWSPENENKIVQHFSKNEEPKSILIRNFKQDVNSIEKLISIRKLKGLVVLSDITEFLPIDSFLELEVLVCVNKMPSKVDLDKLPNLKILSISANNVINLNLTNNLEALHLENVNPDLNLSKNKNLLEISFHNGSLENFNGLSNLIKLKKIEARNMRLLKSLNGLNENLQNLEHIEIFRAEQLQDLNAISTLKNLKTVYLQSIPDVDNLNFVKDLINLDRLVMGCNVKDIDKNCIKNISEIFIPKYNANTLN